MGSKDKRVDAYIADAEPFARPILKHIRALVHRSVPGVQETMKWSFPHFDYHGIMCAMAAFKQHCAFGFWKASLLSDPHRILGVKQREGMGHFGKLTSPHDLPADRVFAAYLKEAARLNAEGIKRPARRKAVPKPLAVPAYFRTALKGNPKALATFEGFSVSRRREYVEWVGEAKTAETRMRRLATSIEWMAEGKERNWKYARK